MNGNVTVKNLLSPALIGVSIMTGGVYLDPILLINAVEQVIKSSPTMALAVCLVESNWLFSSSEP